MMASAVRKTFSEAGTRLPRSDSTPSAKAMSVAVGIAQPGSASGLARLMTTYTSAGTIMPPTAAMPGKARRDQLES